MKYLLFILSAFLFYSCTYIKGSGHVITDNRNVDSFNGVQVSGSLDAEITNGDNRSVKVEADDNAQQYIITEVNDGMLNIHYKEGISTDDVHAKIYVTAPALKRLFISGSGNITSSNTIKTNESFSADISGSGDLDAEIDAPEVKATISGSGNLSLRGRCKNFDGNIGGSGDLKCKNLLSENASVNIAGSGTAHVFASVSINASVAGSGDIYYGGKPPSTQINKAGSGSIEAE